MGVELLENLILDRLATGPGRILGLEQKAMIGGHLIREMAPLIKDASCVV